MRMEERAPSVSPEDSPAVAPWRPAYQLTGEDGIASYEPRLAGLYAAAPNVQSPYAWLRENCDIQPVKAKEAYRVGRVDEADSEVNQLAAGTPAFVVERIAFDSRGPFEYALSTMRADRYEIRSTLYV